MQLNINAFMDPISKKCEKLWLFCMFVVMWFGTDVTTINLYATVHVFKT